MQLNGLLELLRATPDYGALLDSLRNHTAPESLDLLRAARPFLTTALATDLNRPVIYVSNRVDRAYNTAEQLPVWSDDVDVLRFAEPGPLFYERAPWSDTALSRRLEVLAALAPPPLATFKRTRPLIVVTSARSLMQKTLPVREFKASSRLLRRGGQQEPEKLLRTLIGLGYEPTTITIERGTFSRRGGIVDVFPAAAAQPVRIEFFGDEIESIRVFDPASQRSDQEIEQITLSPAREALPRLAPPVAAQLKDWFAAQQPNEDEAESESPVHAHARHLAEGLVFPDIEYYLPYMYSYPANLLSYAPKDALIVVDDWAALHDTVEDLETQAIGLREEKEAEGELSPDYPLPYVTWDELQEELTDRPTLHLGSTDLLTATNETQAALLADTFQPGPRFSGQLKPFLDYLVDLRLREEPTLVVTRQAERLAEMWGQQDAYLAPLDEIPTAQDLGHLQFVEGALAEGWTLRQKGRPRLHLLTDSEIFGWKRPEPRRTHKPRAKAPEATFADLEPGDYVVHVEYGIGRFVGLQKRLIGGDEREYLVIQYEGTDQLFVPIHQADRVARYMGAGEQAPKLSKLGTQDWSRVKESTRQAVEEVARELLELYARREAVKGYTFKPDTPWQHELEAAFPYIETEDQLRAIRDVKADMERSRPMDRLICGDVGYGKTEVALRAAFKAVMDGKQVAILVPTTVLAQQHYNNFKRRMAPFPIKVEMLSRFRDANEQRKILYELNEGQIDIIIGTHRLLQADIALKDLGLLVIDEEQRFGVTHKEKLKRLRTEVDVLTLTATPIPRTLYMALTGIRDVSTIQTPPEERLPVTTHVGVYNRGTVRQAILRELERGGQVFYVHNRVQTIEHKVQELHDLVPEARIELAHGQMDEQQLEQAMYRFAQGDFDVLACTTIIESGLDIPNANTLIIDRADLFGLAQLYQLRGRVGRGAMRAYAYFFHPSWHKLTEDAASRLETIKEYNELGSGFHVAMRDLELRGAGDILGARQSGHIAAVGFHLYTQLLTQAVNRLKNGQNGQTAKPSILGPAQPEPTLTIDLPISAYIPTDYISDMGLRLQLYRRLADLETDQAIDEIGDELADRFGPLPDAVHGLLYQLKVKRHAQTTNATAIGNEDGQIYVKLPYLAEIDRAELQTYLNHGVRISRTAVWLPRDLKREDWQDRLLDLLQRLNRRVIQVEA